MKKKRKFIAACLFCEAFRTGSWVIYSLQTQKQETISGCYVRNVGNYKPDCQGFRPMTNTTTMDTIDAL